MESNEAIARIGALETRIRRLQVAVVTIVSACAVAVLTAWHPGQVGVLRARQLIIEDSVGRERMRIGPQSDFGGQRSPSMGMSINDTMGFERFGMGLRASGRMSMGFDAPLGAGDDRNRERINIIADEQGGAQIRFLDRQTAVKGRLSITPDNRFVVEFLDFSRGSVRSRLVTFAGDTVVSSPR
jgi:hypothetical protein